MSQSNNLYSPVRQTKPSNTWVSWFYGINNSKTSISNKSKLCHEIPTKEYLLEKPIRQAKPSKTWVS